MTLNEIIKKYNIILLVTFGSYNTDRFTDKSDIDIAYKSKNPLSNDDIINLISDLISHFKRDKIDLVDIKRANPLLLYEIACNSKVLYEEEDSFLRFKLYASSRYADTKHLRQARKEYLNQVAKELEKDIDYSIGGF